MASDAEAQRWAAATLKTLSLEQKVGQMICEQMRGEYIPESDEKFQYWMALARDYGIGGFVVYGGSPHETARLLNRLQQAAAIPLLVSADFEAGPGQQFAGASEFPANMALSAIGSEALAYEVGAVGAREGRAIGIHLTYSPVVDIQTRPENPVLGVRSFGPDLDLLGRLARSYIKGYQDNGMLATAKHYPGRGDVELIPGTEFTINRKPAAEVETQDLAAFKRAIEAGVAFVMSEHIAIPSLTNGSDLPASVEKKLASDWLRQKLGFQGVLTSDDLWYAKMTDRFGAERACILAVAAGHDVVLKPADAIKTLKALVAAVRAGEIPEAQIDQSVNRILYWKARLNLHTSRLVDESRIAAIVGAKAHRDLVRRIADESITVAVNNGFFPSTAQKIGRVLHISIQRDENDPAPAVILGKLRAAFPALRNIAIRPSAGADLYAQAIKAASDADTTVVSLFSQRLVYKDNGALRDVDRVFIADLAKVKPSSTVVMAYGNPYLVASARSASAVVVAYGEGGFYGNQTIYADSFIRLLKGEIIAKGHLPVRMPAL